MATYVFGEIEGQPVGTSYPNRMSAMRAGVHQVWVQGISGSPDAGVNSIAITGGYEDDRDFGDTIIYTGAGGKDPSTKRQIADQELTQTNAALVVSEVEALPVRVLRGSAGDPKYSPATGYRYDGLFRVEAHWAEPGKSGFRIWRFRLVRLTENEAAPYVPEQDLLAGNQRPDRTDGVTQRIVRDTAVSRAVKQLHDHVCQVCGTRLSVPVADYAEGAHIRGLGRPHDGPDILSNLLCLCPNDHVLFDKGAIYIADDLTVWTHDGKSLGALRLAKAHTIDLEHVQYHRTASGM